MVTKTKTPPVAAGGVSTKDEKLMQNLPSNTMTAVDVNSLIPFGHKPALALNSIDAGGYSHEK